MKLPLTDSKGRRRQNGKKTNLQINKNIGYRSDSMPTWKQWRLKKSNIVVHLCMVNIFLWFLSYHQCFILQIIVCLVNFSVIGQSHRLHNTMWRHIRATWLLLVCERLTRLGGATLDKLRFAKTVTQYSIFPLSLLISQVRNGNRRIL